MDTARTMELLPGAPARVHGLALEPYVPGAYPVCLMLYPYSCIPMATPSPIERSVLHSLAELMPSHRIRYGIALWPI